MLDIRDEDRNYNYYFRIQDHKVKEAWKKMSSSKIVRSEIISIEVWKVLEKAAMCGSPNFLSKL